MYVNNYIASVIFFNLNHDSSNVLQESRKLNISFTQIHLVKKSHFGVIILQITLIKIMPPPKKKGEIYVPNRVSDCATEDLGT